MPRTKLDEWYADYLLGTLPDAGKQIEAGRQEFVQTGVWLVGLSATLLALFLANLGKFAFLSTGAEKWVVGLLGIAVLLGIVQRTLALVAAGREINARGELRGWLVGFRSHTNEAEPIDQEWSPDELVNRLRDHFDLDAAFLLEAPDASERLRTAYCTVYEGAREADKERLELVVKKLGEYMCWEPEEVREHLAAFTPVPTGGTEVEHAKVVGCDHKFWLGCSGLAFYGSGFALAGAIGTVCISFLAK